MLANLQQQLNPETVVFELSFLFSAWGITYFFIAYIAPLLAAYVWADKAVLAVYTAGMILLFVAILLVLIVDGAKNAGNHGRRGGHCRPPM